MAEQAYRLDLGYRESVDQEIGQVVAAFRRGRLGVIATTRSLCHYEHLVSQVRPDLAEALRVFVGIDSLTDALPIGRLREMWHPETAEIEDRKVVEAEACYRVLAVDACDEVARLLN